MAQSVPSRSMMMQRSLRIMLGEGMPGRGAVHREDGEETEGTEEGSESEKKKGRRIGISSKPLPIVFLCVALNLSVPSVYGFSARGEPYTERTEGRQRAQSE